MDSRYETVSESDIEDFNNSCKSCNYDPEGFKLIEHDVIYVPCGGILYEPKGKLTISRNEKSKTYITGDGSSWPDEFDIDLKAGIFK
jgi:hypothetical protein